MKTTELTPVNGRKSFGGKAKIIEENGVSQLLSYNTVVAEYNPRENKVRVFGYHSATTMTHINSFLSYYGFETVTKKELEKQYLNN